MKPGLAVGFALAIIGGGAEAADPLSNRFDWSGEDWLQNRGARKAASVAQAGLLRQAHDRVSGALLTAADADLLDHLRNSAGTLPAASDAFSPFATDERNRYLDFQIETRVCGAWLVSYIRPDGDRVGWVTADEVRNFGKLDQITATGIEAWGRDNPADPDLIGCGLPAGAPAIVSRWRAPAAERRTRLGSEWQLRDCPVAEVGTGIRERREIRTVRDGFGADVAASGSVSPWIETGRNCRTPQTGAVVMPLDCAVSGGGLNGRRSVRLVSYPWVEARSAQDARKIDFVVDWANPTVIQDLCKGGPGEQVKVNRSKAVNSRNRTCAAVHGSGYRLGGPVDEEQDEWTTDIEFPASWKRPAAKLISTDPWRIIANDCHRERSMSETTAHSSSCPAGQTGSITERRRRDWSMVEYAAPVPARSDHAKTGSETSSIVSTSNSCRTDDDRDKNPDDRKYYRDKETGREYDRRPPGSDPGAFTDIDQCTGACDDASKYKEHQDEHRNGGNGGIDGGKNKDKDKDEGGGGGGGGGGGW